MDSVGLLGAEAVMEPRSHRTVTSVPLSLTKTHLTSYKQRSKPGTAELMNPGFLVLSTGRKRSWARSQFVRPPANPAGRQATATEKRRTRRGRSSDEITGVLP